MEQPQERGYRFRYKSEGATHGGIQGNNTRKGKKTYPTIQIHNFHGPIKVVVQLVTTDSHPILHPHRLDGKHCVDGFYVQDFLPNDNMIFQLHHLSILHVTKKEVPSFLLQRIEDDKKLKRKILLTYNLPYDNEWRTNIDEGVAKNTQMNAVRLKLSVYLKDKDSGAIINPQPLIAYSSTVFDSKCAAACTPRICRMDKKKGCCKGGDEVFLLCDKVQRDDIEVRFFEMDKHGKGIWQAFGDFAPQDVHRQVAIVFRTPAYHNTNIEQPVNVRVELRRKQDGASSPSFPFEYTPEESEIDQIVKKRKKPLPRSLDPRSLDPRSLDPRSSRSLNNMMNSTQNYPSGTTNAGGSNFSDPNNIISGSGVGQTNSMELWDFDNSFLNYHSPDPQLNHTLSIIEEIISSDQSIGSEDSGVETPCESVPPNSDNEETLNFSHVNDWESDASPVSPPLQSTETDNGKKIIVTKFLRKQLKFLHDIFPIKNNLEKSLYISVCLGEKFLLCTYYFNMKGVSISYKDNRENTALHIALSNDCSVCLVEILLKTKNILDYIDSRNNNGYTALHLAVINNKINEVEALINAGADINVGNDLNGRTPLYLAVNGGNIDIIRLLLDQPTIDVDLPDSSGYTPLGIAMMKNDTRSVEFLLKANADIEAVHDDGLPVQKSNLTKDVRFEKNFFPILKSLE